MSAQVENQVENEAVAKVIEIAGAMEKFKVVVDVDGGQAEFAPYDTVERADEMASKFLAKGYSVRVATIFTCSSVALALRQWADRPVEELVDAEVEGENAENGEDVIARLVNEVRDEAEAVDPIALRAEELAHEATAAARLDVNGALEDAYYVPVEAAWDEAHEEEVAREAAKAEAAKPAKPAPRARRTRKAASNA